MSETPFTTDEQTISALCGHSNCKGNGSYQLRVVCYNCSWKGRVKITKGHEFSRYSQSCPGCGCSTLGRVFS